MALQKVPGSLLESVRNYLVNSNLDFWQATTSTTIGNGVSTYGPDQWYGKNSLGTNGVLTISQVTGSSDGAKYGCKLQITTAPTAAQANGCELYQTLDNLQSMPLYNQSASFSIKVKAFGNVNQVGIQFFYKTTEAKVDTAIGSEVLTTVNSSSFVTCTINSQALGTLMTTSGVIGVRIRITGVSSGNTYDLNNGFSIEQGQLNVGSPAPWSRAGHNIQGEFALCQRYYETGVSHFFGTSSGGNAYGGTIYFAAEKRTAPTMTKGSFNNAANSTTNVLDSSTTRIARHLFSNSGASGVSCGASEGWTADARI